MNNNNIQSQLSANAKALEWGHVYLHGKELADFREKLISNRIKLKRLYYANNVNPAAAIFGESQVGKSYMVDCLLTSEKEVLNVYNGEGKPTGFLESINPLGGGKEATSLISRFTTHQVWTDGDYPVKATMLSPIDIVIVLLDAYYNDVINHDFPKGDAVKEESNRLTNLYKGRPIVQSIITEDEIFELKEYLTSGLVSRGEAFREALIDSNYLENLALLINHIEVEQWADVFEFLWNKNDILTNIFKKLIYTLKRMNFRRTIYIKIDAILRKTGTILHVDRLYELFGISEIIDEKGNKRQIEKASDPVMSIMTDEGNKMDGILKSEFCALAMELAFTIVNPQENNDTYLEKKPFLKDSDILDFPGARSRKMIEANIISQQDACEMILRGKVAYLFNKYSQQYLITNLLFCHHDIKSEVMTLSSLLKGWVESTIGKTPLERQEFMKIADISPLFLIGTKFNLDLKIGPDDSKGDSEARDKAKEYRWAKRFEMLENLIAPSVANNWLNEWTPNTPFKNTYLLRSYEYSCQDGLYVGYQEQRADKDNPEGVKLWKLVYKKGDGTIIYEDEQDDPKKFDGSQTLQGELDYNAKNGYDVFIPGLKKSFLNNVFVRNHFEDKEKSWNEVATPGKDGSAWIIENLTRSSSKMALSRNAQFSRVSQDTFNILVDSLYDLYHDDNSDLELRKQMQAVGSITSTFDYLFGSDKYFFTDFISSMVIGEEDLHDVIMDIANNTIIVNETDLSALFAIRARANIDNNLSFEENKNRIKKAYFFTTDEELQRWLDEKKLTLEDIINPPKMMSFSRIIADAVEHMWVDSRLSLEHYDNFIKRGLSEKDLKQLLDNTSVLFKDKIKLSDKIAKKIHPFVAAAIDVTILADMLADICAEMINRFVNTMGAAYYEKEMWEDVQSTISHNSFDVKLHTDEFGQIEFDTDLNVPIITFDDEKTRESLPAVFDTFENVDKILNEVPIKKEKLEFFSNYQEYYKWTELMKVSFLATQGIPKYDVVMNNALRTLIVASIMQKEGLEELVKCNTILQSLQTIKVNENN